MRGHMGEEMRVLRAAERVAAPWSNGGGVTREIAAHPDGAGWDAFDWRISLADVTRDGPYSPLPGIRRILTVADGAGLHLTVDGTAHPPLPRHTPFAFPGAAATDSRLVSGPVVNLNVMTREGRAGADVRVVRGGCDLAAAPGRTMVVALPDGMGDGPGAPGGSAAVPGGAVVTSGGATAGLGCYDAVLLPGGAAARLRTDGVAAVITLVGEGAGDGER
ncbi:HutD family protein [Streptomyces sp. NPDC014733]|uniref:HutD/Ves family protein n=1 Tax=Streptomyces sp. NPDC014733 TaxID=3364885 RepID=UPI0036FC0036